MRCTNVNSEVVLLTAMEDELHSFLIWALNGGVSSATRLSCCNPSERETGSLWMVAMWVPGYKNSQPIFLLFTGKLQLSTVSRVLQGKMSWGSSGKKSDLLSPGQGKLDRPHGPVNAKAYPASCRMRRPTGIFLGHGWRSLKLPLNFLFPSCWI